MDQHQPTPMINDDGDVRDLTDAEYSWAVRDEDFGGVLGSLAFLKDREAFFAIAEKLGMEREAFLAFAPSKPGFIERATDAMDALVKQVRHAAE
jgi:hypothetical protein